MTILVILFYSSFSTICFSMDNLLSQNVHSTRATVVIPLMVLDASDISSLFHSFFRLLNSLLKVYEDALQPQYGSLENDPLFWKSVTLYHLITVLLLGGLDQQLLEIHHISLPMRTLSLRQPFQFSFTIATHPPLILSRIIELFAFAFGRISSGCFQPP